MKNLLITTIWLLTSLTLFSQSDYAIHFEYDNAGNRTERHVIELDSPENKSGYKQNEELLKQQVYSDKIGEQEIKIYPNPTTGRLFIEVKGYEKVNSSSVVILNVTGEILMSEKDFIQSTTIDLSVREKGAYFIQIILDEKKSSWKVIKQ